MRLGLLVRVGLVMMAEHGDSRDSLLRLYQELGKADSYRAVLDALRSGLRDALGHDHVWLQLVAASDGTPSAWPD